MPTAPHPSTPRTLVSNFRLERLIHVGRRASTYRAFAPDGSVGALKLFLGAALRDADTVGHFLRELAELSRFSHFALPRLLDHGVLEGGVPWLVHEWLAGWDLETHRTRLGGRLPAHELLEISAALLDPLTAAHAVGLSHQDLKPSNLFLTESGELRLLNFGLNAALAHVDPSSASGSPPFAAPERALRPEAARDPRSDVWSVGATLFTLASGRLLHDGSADGKAAHAPEFAARTLAELSPELPRELSLVIQHALSADPTRRFQSALEMRTALFGPAPPASAPVPPALRDPAATTMSTWSRQQSTTEQGGERGIGNHPIVIPTVLRLVSGPDLGTLRNQVLPIRGELVVGRDVGDVGWSIADGRVSRRHLRIVWDDRFGCYRAMDMQSRNGIRVNGARETSARLAHGDVVRIGDSILVVIHGSRMQIARDLVQQTARSITTVLVFGETGVGKEVIAREIHAASERSGPFVPVNCGALPRDLAASELFGHTRGAFSGATGARRGVFQAAERGTLLLDEIGELPLHLQPLLLRALQQRAVRPVGADEEHPVDVRVIAATNVRLDDAVVEGRFRADLYARLAQVPIELPPLRERREEILELAALFAIQAQHRLQLAPDVAEALLLWPWPYNVRELENLVQRWCAMSTNGAQFSSAELARLAPAMAAAHGERGQAQVQPSQPTLPANPAGLAAAAARDPLRDRDALDALLRECDGNVSEVARRLGTTRAQVYRWMARLGLSSPRSPGQAG
jgi:DNA-binding NtrC family response regulator/serine/threonine protein kinase